jgi:uncharacterized membrane protein YebE (DUF533 family)
MFDANKILGSLLGSPAAQGFAGGVAGGMLTSKSGRKMAKKGLKYGGIAAVGALAFNAWQQHKKNQMGTAPGQAAPAAQPTPTTHAAPTPQPQAAPAAPELPPAPAGSAFLPAAEDQQAANALGLVLVRAMIAAANADGRLDSDEMRSILDRMDGMDLGDDDKAVLIDELRKPVEIDELVAAADTPEKATEIYVAALLAIEVDTAGERFWLKELASRLQLPDDVVQSIHAQVEAG